MAVSDIQLTVITTGANQTVTVNRYFSNAHTINWGDGSPTVNHTAGATKTYTGAGTYTITLALTGSATRWTFHGGMTLVPKIWTTASNVYVSYMPALSDYFGNNATNVGNNFFFGFNANGSLTSLPS